MRISDWSSDVCSSDLIKQRDHRAATNFRIMPASRIRGRPAGTLPLLEALQLHALIKWNNRVDLALRVPVAVHAEHRSEERRVGKECVSTCRSRWSPYH